MGSLGVILWAVADATRMRGGSLGLCALRHAWLTLRSRKLSLGSRRVRKGLGADPWWQECRWEQGYSLAGKVQNQVITRQRATESAGCGWRALQALYWNSLSSAGHTLDLHYSVGVCSRQAAQRLAP